MAYDTYTKRDILTGTKEVIIDREAMMALNKDNIQLLRDIKKLLNRLIPAAQLIAVPNQATSVTNGGPVDVNFMDGTEQRVATTLLLSGSADFFFDFDRPASINSPRYDFTQQNGAPLIFSNVEVARLSVLAASGTALVINSFATNNAPNANYIAVRAWAPARYRDDTAIL